MPASPCQPWSNNSENLVHTALPQSRDRPAASSFSNISNEIPRCLRLWAMRAAQIPGHLSVLNSGPTSVWLSVRDCKYYPLQQSEHGNLVDCPLLRVQRSPRPLFSQADEALTGYPLGVLLADKTHQQQDRMPRTRPFE